MIKFAVETTQKEMASETTNHPKDDVHLLEILASPLELKMENQELMCKSYPYLEKLWVSFECEVLL